MLLLVGDYMTGYSIPNFRKFKDLFPSFYLHKILTLRQGLPILIISNNTYRGLGENIHYSIIYPSPIGSIIS
jgi:hypothetical protein